MNLIRIYLRTLGLLAPAARLAWTLAIANLLLAGAQFAEPVLFGRVIDTLSQAQANASGFSWSRLASLLAAWTAFGLFNIVCSTLVALYADRLAHGARQHVLTNYFEHVLAAGD